MNESYDKARHIVHQLRGEGFQVRLDGECVDVNPMSKLQDNQREMLLDHIDEVTLFLRCESAVDHFLFVRAGGCLYE